MTVLASDRWRSHSEILATVQAFEDRTLPREEWDHEAHLAVGLVYVRRHGGAALRMARDGIQAYNAATGRTEKERNGYREDVTCYFMQAIAAVVAASPIDSLVAQLQKLMTDPTTGR